MVFSFRSTILCFLLFTVCICCVSGKATESINVEDIEDPQLKERVSQVLAAEIAKEEAVSEEGDGEADSGRAPQASLIAADFSRRGNLCGLFILCERGLSGYPEARLFQGYNTRFYTRFSDCSVSKVKGTCNRTGVSNDNHARLWPVFGEEFYEMCFYEEKKIACRTGQVMVVRNPRFGHPTIVYRCRQYYDAHTVEFCMNKFSYFCRWRNPLLVPLPVSVARA